MRLLKGRGAVGAKDESIAVGNSSESAHRLHEVTEENSNSCGPIHQSLEPTTSRRAKGLRKVLRRKRNRNNKSSNKQENNPNRGGGMEGEEYTTPSAQNADSPSQDQQECDTDSFSLTQQDRSSLQSIKFTSSAEMAILHHSYTNEEEMEPLPPSRLSERKTQSFRPTIEAALSSRMVNDTRSEYCERRWQSIGEDPTVEESIECVFSHQLEDGEILFDMPFAEDGSATEEPDDTFMSHAYQTPQKPRSSLLSSFFRSEAHLSLTDQHHHSINDSFSDNDGSHQKRMYNSAKLVHVSSVLDSSKEESSPIEKEPSSVEKKSLTTPNSGSTTPAEDEDTKMPSSSLPPPLSQPIYWPQRPLLLRAKPGSGTTIKGIRFSGSMDYLSKGSEGWWKDLRTLWDQEQVDEKINGLENCSCIPINNGNEEKGKALVVDFETPLFVGTILVRIRNAKGTIPNDATQETGYFAGVNRQYQAVIQGRFRKAGIPMTECVCGNIFSSPITPPAPYVVRGALKVFNFFAPRLQAKLNGNQPLVLSPLGSTPQSITVDIFNGKGTYNAGISIEEKQEEPCKDSRRLLSIPRDVTLASNFVRAKARKREFDHMCAVNDKSLTFDTAKVYTFEFLQHLVDFSEFEMSLGSVIGKYKLNGLLNSQPLTIMAAHQIPLDHAGHIGRYSTVVDGQVFNSIWSFELWHESLFDKV